MDYEDIERYIQSSSRWSGGNEPEVLKMHVLSDNIVADDTNVEAFLQKFSVGNSEDVADVDADVDADANADTESPLVLDVNYEEDELVREITPTLEPEPDPQEPEPEPEPQEQDSLEILDVAYGAKEVSDLTHIGDLIKKYKEQKK
jgi:hypothetical protein